MTYPVLIIEDDRIRSRKIDTQSSRTCAKEEQVRCTGLVTAILEQVHLLSAVYWSCRPVDATDIPPFHLTAQSYIAISEEHR